VAEAIEAMGGGAGCGDGRVPEDFDRPACPDDLPCVPDEQVTTAIDASAYLEAKLAAMRAHATQIAVDGRFYALSNRVAQRVSGVEYYTLLAGPLVTVAREDDLFAGVASSPAPVSSPAPARMPGDATASQAG
jgi:N-acetyl-1-D-myo-inositol-2-amino-2-deoxy-alpha-D-glucopyranoside deacetylase